MNWKGCGRKPSWPNLTYYSRPCLEGLRKSTKNFRQDRRCPDQHLNPGHSEYEGGNHSTMTCDERMDESRFTKRQKIGEEVDTKRWKDQFWFKPWCPKKTVRPILVVNDNQKLRWQHCKIRQICVRNMDLSSFAPGGLSLSFQWW
jgi:hypothetical protein